MLESHKRSQLTRQNSFRLSGIKISMYVLKINLEKLKEMDNLTRKKNAIFLKAMFNFKDCYSILFFRLYIIFTRPSDKMEMLFMCVCVCVYACVSVYVGFSGGRQLQS